MTDVSDEFGFLVQREKQILLFFSLRCRFDSSGEAGRWSSQAPRPAWN